MQNERSIPRIIIAGSGGDAGKTIVSAGLTACWRKKGLQVAPFKKGPDYIDAAWLKAAGGIAARNLDTYIMGVDGVKRSFYRNSAQADICLIEGNRGLYDGFDVHGTHSTAELAKILKTPVVLVINVTKVTRTAAAFVLGCQKMDTEVDIAGVIINQVSGSRHEKIIRDSIEQICGIPVLGAVPRLKGENLLPGRHLGLVTPEEHGGLEGLFDKIADLIEKYVDTGKILDFARQAPVLDFDIDSRESKRLAGTVKIGYFSDSSFTFYYPDNLEALQAEGAVLIPISSLNDKSLPECGGLLIGGGFPETHAEALSKNIPLLDSVIDFAAKRKPVYAECGGLIYLCRSLKIKDKIYQFAGVFPLDLEMMSNPQGHGYSEVEVDRRNPYFPIGTILRGHEFHYTRIISGSEDVNTAYSVLRGTGCFGGRDGLFSNNVLASYLHLHASGTPQWAENFVNLILAKDI
ncbi:MAG: hydrogenobyrinic acid a,c-diamide synthase (glutamine-hydrolyzing) [FCB group bacterium]|nr:hydrogenobyrinic acid a,c-diamide synthase (glutamine-hydrolyzing) [FCB group bacterium]